MDARGQWWTRELVIQRIQEYDRRYGHPPSAVDWNVSMARTVGRQNLVDRFYTDGCWPHGSTLRRWFENWNDAIRAAGFEPSVQANIEIGTAEPALEAATGDSPPIRPIVADSCVN